MNHFSYADDLALVAHTARAINNLLRICEEFFDEHYIVFSPTKLVCLVVFTKGCKLDSAPKVYRLKVGYYNIIRRFVGVPPWASARTMFVTLGIRSFDENLRYCAMSCKK